MFVWLPSPESRTAFDVRVRGGWNERFHPPSEVEERAGLAPLLHLSLPRGAGADPDEPDRRVVWRVGRLVLGAPGHLDLDGPGIRARHGRERRAAAADDDLDGLRHESSKWFDCPPRKREEHAEPPEETKRPGSIFCLRIGKKRRAGQVLGIFLSKNPLSIFSTEIGGRLSSL